MLHFACKSYDTTHVAPKFTTEVLGARPGTRGPINFLRSTLPCLVSHSSGCLDDEQVLVSETSKLKTSRATADNQRELPENVEFAAKFATEFAPKVSADFDFNFDWNIAAAKESRHTGQLKIERTCLDDSGWQVALPMECYSILDVAWATWLAL